HIVERHRRPQRHQQKALPARERDRGEVVALRRETFGTIEFGHRMEAPVEREPAPVVAAAELRLVAGALDDEGAAMRAHVGQAMDLVVRVAREEQGLVQRARQQRERVDLACHLDDLVVSGPLPRAREDALALGAEDLRIGVHARGQRASDADVRVDGEVQNAAMVAAVVQSRGERRVRDRPPLPFALLARTGYVEILTSGATHGYLPLLDTPSVHAQLAVGTRTTRRRIGVEPRGIWLPECAYAPGLEEILELFGLTHFFIDPALLGSERLVGQTHRFEARRSGP